MIYKSGYPGLPLHIQFLAPFQPLVNLTDDLTTVAGLSPTMYDLPDLGASIKLMQPREVKRNFYEAQPDPRKAPEIPPQAVANSSAKLEQQRLIASTPRRTGSCLPTRWRRAGDSRSIAFARTQANS